MADDLLADILTVEREISQRISLLAQETADSLRTLGSELDADLEREADRMRSEMHSHLEKSEEMARRDAAALLGQANAYADRLDAMGDPELDREIEGCLSELLQEETNDSDHGQS